MKHIIAITGYKQSGKSTVAQMVTELCPEYNQLSLATPIKMSLATIFGWGQAELEGVFKERIDPYWGISPRRAMQLMGTELFQFDMCNHDEGYAKATGRYVWCKSLDSYANRAGMDKIVIADLRFPHELEYFKTHGYKVDVIRVNRPSTISTNHASEQEMDSIVPDYIINNDGSIGELTRDVYVVLRHMKTQEVK